MTSRRRRQVVGSGLPGRLRLGPLLGLFVVLMGACESPQAPATAPPPADQSGAGQFSGEDAWDHLESLTSIGPRVSGTKGARRARTYLRKQLAELGAEVQEYRFEVGVPDPEGGLAVESVEIVHLVGVLPGDSDDIFLLAAPYDTAEVGSFRFVGANGGASGPAILLEMARVLASRPRPYTVWLSFLDGDALSPAGADPVRFPGSERLAKQWAEAGVLDRVRFAVFFDRVADADLTIARDLWSHSVYRDLVWEAAGRMGHAEQFPLDHGFESPATGHRAFLDQRLRRVVALVDTRYGAGEPPGSYWRSEDDLPRNCSPDSLAIVGRVTLEALDQIGQRLTKIDRFARSPL